MERGLLWLLLLMIFIWLAWSGWNEYQKVEVYRLWAENCDHSKYDIYAVLGQKDNQLTWGKPTRSGVVNLQTLNLEQVSQVNLLVNEELVDLASLPEKGSATLELILKNQSESFKIPFTEINLAAEWVKYLQAEIKKIA